MMIDGAAGGASLAAEKRVMRDERDRGQTNR